MIHERNDLLLHPAVVIGMRLRRPIAGLAAALVGLALASGSSVAADRSTWIRYHAFDGRLQFSYPADLLAIISDSTQVLLLHSVPYRHYDPCDFGGNGERVLDHLVDMAVSFQLDERPVLDAIRARQAFAVVDDSIRADGRVRFDALHGVRIQAAVENCGQQRYYFFTHPSTLIVERDVIPLFGYSSKEQGDTIRSLPGVILRKQGDDLFGEILATVAMAPEFTSAPRRPDRTPLPAPSLRIGSIYRGIGAVRLPDGGIVTTSDVDDGSILLEVDVPANETTLQGLHFRIHVIDGDLPYGFQRPLFDEATPMKSGWVLNVNWDDGGTWNQEAFSFRFVVSYVDKAGNESAWSDTLVVEHNGDMTVAKENQQSQYAQTIEFIDNPGQQFKGEWPQVRVPVALEAERELAVEEHLLPEGFRVIECASLSGSGVDPKLLERRAKWRVPSSVDVNRDAFTLGSKNYRIEVQSAGRLAMSADATHKLTVMCDKIVAYEATTKHPSDVAPVTAFYGWSEHWVLEYWNHVVLDDWDLNRRHNFDRSFFCRPVAGKPFYFAEVHGDVRLCWDGKIPPEKYDDVYYRPSAAMNALNPSVWDSMVGFFGKRDERWYYVEAGVFRE